MAICRIYEIEGATLAQYDEVNAKFPEHPAGSRIHVAGVADGRLCVVEVWESTKDADEYMATGVGEAIDAAGITGGTMTEFEIHNLTEPT